MRRVLLLVLPLLLAAVAAAAARPGDPLVHGVGSTNDPGVKVLSWPSTQLRLPQVWTSRAQRQPTIVAIVDTGVSPVSDLAGALLPGVDLVNGDDDPVDDNGHGTAIASIAAARAGNGIGVAGVCGSCQI